MQKVKVKLRKEIADRLLSKNKYVGELADVFGVQSQTIITQLLNDSPTVASQPYQNVIKAILCTDENLVEFYNVERKQKKC